jgi:hypothetical protein
MPTLNLGNVVGLLVSETAPEKTYILWAKPLGGDVFELNYYKSPAIGWIPLSEDFGNEALSITQAEFRDGDLLVGKTYFISDIGMYLRVESATPYVAGDTEILVVDTTGKPYLWNCNPSNLSLTRITKPTLQPIAYDAWDESVTYVRNTPQARVSTYNKLFVYINATPSAGINPLSGGSETHWREISPAPPEYGYSYDDILAATAGYEVSGRKGDVVTKIVGDPEGEYKLLTYKALFGSQADPKYYTSEDFDDELTAGDWKLVGNEEGAGGGGVSLGETNTTAYRGDRGKTAYDHSQNKSTDVEADKLSDTKWVTVKAVYDHVEAEVIKLWKDQGNYDPTTTTLYPVAADTNPEVDNILAGFVWTITGLGSGVEGEVNGKIIQDGDIVRALIDNPAADNDAHWAVQEGNLGYTPENVAKKTGDLNDETAGSYPTTEAVRAADEQNVKLEGEQVILGAKKFLQGNVYAVETINTLNPITPTILSVEKEYVVISEIENIRAISFAATPFSGYAAARTIKAYVAGASLNWILNSAGVGYNYLTIKGAVEDQVYTLKADTFYEFVNAGTDSGWYIFELGDSPDFVNKSGNNDLAADFIAAFNNGSRIYQGPDEGRGGAGGTVIECSVGYKWQFENGYMMLRATGDGLIYHVISINGNIPEIGFDISKGFGVGCKFYSIPSDKMFVCTSNAATEAVWVSYLPIISITKANLATEITASSIDITKKYKVTDALASNDKEILLTPLSANSFYETCENLTDKKLGRYIITTDWFIPNDNNYIVDPTISEDDTKGYQQGDTWTNILSLGRFIYKSGGVWNKLSGTLTLTNSGTINLDDPVAIFSWSGNVLNFSIVGTVDIPDLSTATDTILLDIDEADFYFLTASSLQTDAIMTINIDMTPANRPFVRYRGFAQTATRGFAIQIDRTVGIVADAGCPISITGQLFLNPPA